MMSLFVFVCFFFGGLFCYDDANPRITAPHYDSLYNTRRVA